jgi:release factor glutamine methyltransferase
MSRSLQDQLADARRDLVRAGLSPEDAALDAEVLARHTLGWDRARVLTHGRESPPPDFDERFSQLVARRARREPVALITGHREFWGLDFEVTSDVLVPRPDTELVIEAALDAVPRTVRRLVDVGTGSGCIAVALALELAFARVVATDTSLAALAVARRNAARHRVSERVTFVRSNLLDALAGPIELIVSNPPYVPAGSALQPEVALYEPASALIAGEDGLATLRLLIEEALPRLAPGGAFVVEFGLGQADAVRTIATSAGWRTVSIREDLQGIPRVAVMM